MATPVTKRMHMNAYKRNSIAKQMVTEDNQNPPPDTGYYVKDGKRYKYTASYTPGTTSSAGGNIINQAKEYDEKFSGTDAEWFKTLSEKGATGEELAKKGFIHKSKIDAYNKLYPIKSTTTPGDYNITSELVMTPGTKGTQVDTSTAYGIRQISRGQKKAARDVRRAKLKAAKYDMKQNDDLTRKEKRKYIRDARLSGKQAEAEAEQGMMEDTLERVKDMAASGVDPRLTARYEYGRGMKEAQESSASTDIKGLPTFEDIQAKYKGLSEGTVNLGTVNSDAGQGTETESVTENLTEDRKPKPTVNKPLSTASASRADIGYSTMVAKKQGGVSMLKKGGMKMGGFGSKTYKK